MPVEKVHEMAQGRIWAATDALGLGLVDELGGLGKAIEAAAEMAGIEDYGITSLPYQKDPLQQIIEGITGSGETRIKSELGTLYPYYNYLKELATMDDVQARLPFELQIR